VLFLKIVYYTSGITGAGRLVRGISIGNALARSDIKCDYVLVSSSSFGRLARRFKHIHIIPDDIKNISKNNYKTSNIFTAMKDLQPDILLVDLLWFPLHHFIQELPCKKIFLCRQVDEKYFSIPTEQDKLIFDKDQYDELLMIEPFSL
jgi:predicted glycosyltransferase